MSGVRFSPASASPQSPGDPLGPIGVGGRRRLLLVAVATGVPALLALIGLSLFFVPLPDQVKAYDYREIKKIQGGR